MTDLANAKEQLTQASRQNNEPAALLQRRLAACELMTKLRLPRMQRFKFADWPLMSDRPLNWVDSATDLEQLAPDDEVIRVTQVGQTTVNVHIPEKLRTAGVILTDIFTAAREHSDLFDR
ncbi:MAG: Fe-S cluster assembly protein SufD, partial [Limosilactobacillus sp.]